MSLGDGVHNPQRKEAKLSQGCGANAKLESTSPKAQAQNANGWTVAIDFDDSDLGVSDPTLQLPNYDE